MTNLIVNRTGALDLCYRNRDAADRTESRVDWCSKDRTWFVQVSKPHPPHSCSLACRRGIGPQAHIGPHRSQSLPPCNGLADGVWVLKNGRMSFVTGNDLNKYRWDAPRADRLPYLSFSIDKIISYRLFLPSIVLNSGWKFAEVWMRIKVTVDARVLLSLHKKSMSSKCEE